MEQILFSALGTSDPVRGLRDGSMLHIVRHYLPDKIVLFFSKEISDYDAKDHRFQLALDDFMKRTPGYHPEIIRCKSDIEDVSEFDFFYDKFEEIVKDLSSQHPAAKILLNLSSGSVQMKMTMAMLATDLRFHTKGIQVKTPEKASSKEERTNSKKYCLTEEIDLNEDFDDDAPNRCGEPELFVLQREANRNQIKALLDTYHYEAISMMKNVLSPECMTLVRHLAKRAEYDCKEAEHLADSLKSKLPFNLYPRRETSKTPGRKLHDYTELSEFFLCLKLLQRTGKLTNFVIRLNPLILRLQQAYLLYYCGFDYRNICEHQGTREIIRRENVQEYSPELLAHLDRQFGRLEDKDIHIGLCNHIISYMKKNEEAAGKLFVNLEALNREKRNTSAHTFDNITEDDIQKYVGISSKILVGKLEQLIQQIYGDLCDIKLFSIFDDCNEYIYNKI